MKILPFIVFSISLLSSYLSEAFLTTPNSPVATAQDAKTSNTTSRENKSISLTLKLQKAGTPGAYSANVFVGTPNNTEPRYQFPMLMSLNSAETSLFTNACSKKEDTIYQCSTNPPFVPSNSASFQNETGNNVVLNTSNRSKAIGYMGTDLIGFSDSKEAKVPTHILFRVNATMEMGNTGLISLSPNKNSFLEVLKNSSQITEQAFMYAINEKSGDFEITFGNIPGISDDTPWFKISKEKWQIDAFYVTVGGQRAQDCSGINRGAFALFNESSKILLPETAHKMLLHNLANWRNQTSSNYKCVPGALENYPNISIYISQYRIEIPPVVYLDLNQMDNYGNCPLAVDALKDDTSCVTLGYPYFGYIKVVFSKDKQEIGLLKKENLIELTAVPLDKYSAPIGLGILVLIFGVVFVRSSQKEEEIRIDIDNTPRQVRSESYYEYSYAE